MPACFWQPSLRLAVVRALLALLTALGVLASGLPPAARLSVALLCAGWALWHSLHARQHCRPNKRRGLRYQSHTGWQLWQATTGWRPIRILAGSLVTCQLIVVYFQDGERGKRQALVVPADVLDTDSHRRLRVWLRFIPLDKDIKRFPVRLAGGQGSPG